MPLGQHQHLLVVGHLLGRHELDAVAARDRGAPAPLLVLVVVHRVRNLYLSVVVHHGTGQEPDGLVVRQRVVEVRDDHEVVGLADGSVGLAVELQQFRVVGLLGHRHLLSLRADGCAAESVVLRHI